MRKQAIVCVLLLGAALAFAAYSVKHKTMMFPFQ